MQFLSNYAILKQECSESLKKDVRDSRKNTLLKIYYTSEHVSSTINSPPFRNGMGK